jgi:hypothetical protein
MTSIVGKTLAGKYKSPDKEEVSIIVEVHATFRAEDRDGNPLTQLLVVRKDAKMRGKVQLLYKERFWEDTLVATDTPDFKPLPGLAEGEWYLTPISLQYSQVERVRTEAGLKHLPAEAKKIVVSA